MRSDFLSVQYLRALAALGVLVFHASQRAGWTFGSGAAGVDVFFVISGFIMWTVSARRAGGPVDFLARRAGRVAPLYWAVTLLVVALDLARPALFPNMRLTPGHVAMSLLFLPHHDPSGAVAPVIVPGWTLNYEAFFYVAFALTLLLPSGRRAPVLSLALGMLCVAGLVLPRAGGAALATYTDPLVLEFVAGVWLAKAAAAGRLGRMPAALAAMAAGLLILTVVALAGADVSGWPRLVEWGLPAVLLVWGALSLEGASRLPAWAPLKRLGDASYSLYLVHGLALSLAFRTGEGLHLPPAARFVLAAPFAVFAGLACHLLVERPLLRVFHRRRGPRAAAWPGLAVRVPTWPFSGSKAQS